MSDVDIFIMESYTNSGFAIASYVLFFVLVCLLEHRFQTSDKPLLTTASLNVVYVVFLWQVLTISEFILGWRSDWVGGELAAILFLPGLAFFILFFAKRMTLAHAGVSFKYPSLICSLPLMVPFAPVLLLLAYVLALGSNWQN